MLLVQRAQFLPVFAQQYQIERICPTWPMVTILSICTWEIRWVWSVHLLILNLFLCLLKSLITVFIELCHECKRQCQLTCILTSYLQPSNLEVRLNCIITLKISLLLKCSNQSINKLKTTSAFYTERKEELVKWLMYTHKVEGRICLFQNIWPLFSDRYQGQQLFVMARCQWQAIFPG